MKFCIVGVFCLLVWPAWAMFPSPQYAIEGASVSENHDRSTRPSFSKDEGDFSKGLEEVHRFKGWCSSVMTEEEFEWIAQTFPGIFSEGYPAFLQRLIHLVQTFQSVTSFREGTFTPQRVLYLEGLRLTALPPTWHWLEPSEDTSESDQAQVCEIFYGSYNLFREAPVALSGLKNIQELFLSHNCLTNFSLPGSALKNLRVLQLSGNQIQAFPSCILSFDQLQFLDLSDNLISQLPSLEKSLPSLSECRLAGNLFSQFPQQLFQLPSLTVLDLSNNAVNLIPYEISALQELKIGLFNRCKLANIPVALLELPKLSRLELAGNFFQGLPEDLKIPSIEFELGL